MEFNAFDKSIFSPSKITNLKYRLATKLIYKPAVTRLNVPIIAVTGTNGKTTVTRLLEKVYLDAGYNVGTCTTDGVSHNGALFLSGDLSWGYGAWKAAQCPDVDLLILETARGGIIRYGMGFRECQVGVVTNLFEDHLGFDGVDSLEQMADVKSTIPIHTHREGSIILNGDDADVRRMVDRSPASPIYFVTGNGHEEFE
ncbi:MAG: Mur ligase family protein, partial [Deltaproteobacteria bacterium]